MKTNRESIVRALATLSFALCLFLCAVPVKAGTIIIDFSGNGPDAQLSFNPNTHVLTGSNIEIDLLTGYNTPLNAGGHTVIGYLSFTTPALSNVGDQWEYSGAEAGTYTIDGKVLDAGIYSIVSLLLGKISYIAYTPFPFVRSVVFALGDDTKDPNLLTYFGVTTSTKFTFNGFTSFTYLSPDTWYASSDIENSAVPVPGPTSSVPEPSELLLLATGLLGIAGYGVMVIRFFRVGRG